MTVFSPIARVSELNRRRLVAMLAALGLVCGATGCGVSGTSDGPAATALTGRILGGQQAVSGASVVLYQAGATGPGTGAVSLLNTPVFSDTNGNFSITNDYKCASSTTQVYLVTRGGNPGLAAGTNNAASVMMVALGDCGNLLTGTNFIFVNEVTTVAAAWGLAQFLAPGGVVGASSTNATGLRNAFGVANNLADTSKGVANGPNLPAGATIEAAKLYTLANVISVCVNSDGGASCNSLFQAASVGGNAPANTLDAALNIVRNPGSQVGAVFRIATAQGPFQPGLIRAPSDWTMSLTYTGGGLYAPTAVALDSTGSPWVANYFGGAASKFSATGQAASAQGYADGVLEESWGITVDGQDNAWVTNEESAYSNNSGDGSISEFNSAGQVLSGTGITAGHIYYPYAIAASADGSIWVADFGRSGATRLAAADGTSLSGASGFSPPNLPFPVRVAVDAAGNAWFGAQDSVAKMTTAGAVNQYGCCNSPSGIAIDQGGYVWLADFAAASLVEVGPDGTTLQHLTGVGGLGQPGNVAVDGAGVVWVTNYRGNSVSAFTGAIVGGTSAAVSPATGYGVDAGLSEPFGLAIDAGGNVWVSNFAIDTLTEYVGLASPVKTPLLGPATAP